MLDIFYIMVAIFVGALSGLLIMVIITFIWDHSVGSLIAKMRNTRRRGG